MRLLVQQIVKENRRVESSREKVDEFHSRIFPDLTFRSIPNGRNTRPLLNSLQENTTPTLSTVPVVAGLPTTRLRLGRQRSRGKISKWPAGRKSESWGFPFLPSRPGRLKLAWTVLVKVPQIPVSLKMGANHVRKITLPPISCGIFAGR